MIAVVGPGAVGGLLAALLHRAGEDVVAVARAETAGRIARDGIVVRSQRFGDFTAPVPAATDVPRHAAVLLTVKTYALDDVLPTVVAAAPRHVLALQNGVGHAARLAATGLDTAAGAIQVEAAREGDVIVHRGDYCIVRVPDAVAGWGLVAALGRAGVSVRPGGTEAELLWRKLSFLAPTALLTTRTDLPLGPALDHDPATTAAVVTEVAALATAEGLPRTAEQLMTTLRSLPPDLRSSLQGDFRRGGPTELEALGGDLVRLGERHEIATPALAAVVAELRQRTGSAGR